MTNCNGLKQIKLISQLNKQLSTIDKIKQELNKRLKIQYIQEHQKWSYYDDQFEETVAMWLAGKGIIPPKEFYHDKYLRNRYENTVQDIFVTKDIIPPREWIYNLENPKCDYKSLIVMTQREYFPTPYQWENPPQNIFYKAMFREIPDIEGHQPDEQDKDGFTVAMILAINNIEIPKEWEHKPELQNDYGFTVAMYMAKRGKIPPKQWIHDPKIKYKYDRTVAKIFAKQAIIPPKEWEYQETNIYCDSVALIFAEKGIVPPLQWHHDPTILFSYSGTIAMCLADKGIQDRQEWYHDPNLQNVHGETVAIILAKNKFIPQQQWYHNPTLTNNQQQTVAMLISKQCKCIPQNQWCHNPLMKDRYFSTVAIYLAQNGIFPPKQWIHNINYKNKDGNSIKSLIYKQIQHSKKYKQQKLLYSIEKLNDICSICLQDGKQQFIKSNCGHKICEECFKQLSKMKKQQLCPICRQLNWYIIPLQQQTDKEWFEFIKKLNYFETLDYDFDDAPYINQDPENYNQANIQ